MASAKAPRPSWPFWKTRRRSVVIAPPKSVICLAAVQVHAEVPRPARVRTSAPTPLRSSRSQNPAASPRGTSGTVQLSPPSARVRRSQETATSPVPCQTPLIRTGLQGRRPRPCGVKGTARFIESPAPRSAGPIRQLQGKPSSGSVTGKVTRADPGNTLRAPISALAAMASSVPDCPGRSRVSFQRPVLTTVAMPSCRTSRIPGAVKSASALAPANG